MAYALANIHDVNNGKAVVICNEEFCSELSLSDINFTNDVKLAELLLENLNIQQTEYHDNQTASQMRDVMNNAATSAHSNTDCLVCVLLSHGKTQNIEQGGINVYQDGIYATDKLILLQELMEIWNCNGPLKGIPKIFIVIACRGSTWSNVEKLGRSEQLPRQEEGPNIQLGETCDEPLSDLGLEQIGNPASRNLSVIPGDIPVLKDFIIVHTTQPGYAAPKPTTGNTPYSPLLKALVAQARKWKELTKIVTYALGDVAYDYEDYNKKLMPWVASRLTKIVRFCPPHSSERKGREDRP